MFCPALFFVPLPKISKEDNEKTTDNGPCGADGMHDGRG